MIDRQVRHPAGLRAAGSWPTQLAWSVMQTMGRLLPMPYPRMRKERLEKAGQRYRELWDEWAAEQERSPAFAS